MIKSVVFLLVIESITAFTRKKYHNSSINHINKAAEQRGQVIGGYYGNTREGTRDSLIAHTYSSDTEPIRDVDVGSYLIAHQKPTSPSSSSLSHCWV